MTSVMGSRDFLMDRAKSPGEVFSAPVTPGHAPCFLHRLTTRGQTCRTGWPSWLLLRRLFARILERQVGLLNRSSS